MKHLISIIKAIWEKHARKEIDYEQHILRMLQSLSDYYACLDTTDEFGKVPRHLEEPIVTKLQKSVQTFLLHYNVLTVTSLGLNQKLWHQVYKCHWGWHIGYEAKFQNPRIVQCYINEDLIDTLCTVANSCRHGIVPAKRSHTMAQKYIMGKSLMMHFRLTGSCLLTFTKNKQMYFVSKLCRLCFHLLPGEKRDWYLNVARG